MRLPAYLLLPIGGAVVLVAAVLGTWLWPEPSVSIPSGPPPAAVAPVAAELPPPPPPAAPQVAPSRLAQRVPPPPPSPVAMPTVPAPSPVAPVPVAKPSEPEPTTPVPPGVPTYSQFTNLTLQQQQQMRNTLSSMSTRAAEMAERGAQELERQRDEAHARGDVAEFNRLNGLLDTYRERMERIHQQRLELAPAQAGPPTQ
jgi:hypothetical protein